MNLKSVTFKDFQKRFSLEPDKTDVQHFGNVISVIRLLCEVTDFCVGSLGEVKQGRGLD